MQYRKSQTSFLSQLVYTWKKPQSLKTLQQPPEHSTCIPSTLWTVWESGLLSHLIGEQLPEEIA